MFEVTKVGADDTVVVVGAGGGLGIEAVQMSDADLKRYTDQALGDAAAGVIAPVIGQTFPLDRVAAAHAAIESRTVFGTTLLTTS